MDIAKIRKKIRQKNEERKTEEKPPAPPADEKKGEQLSVPDRQHDAGTEEKTVSVPTGPAVEKFRETRQPEKPPARAEKKSGEKEDAVVELLTFSLAKKEYAVRVSEVEEIINYQRITSVPTLPEYVSGITSLRGKIIPVVDLKNRLGLIKHKESDALSGGNTMPDRAKADQDDKILIVSGPEGFIGAIIDKVIGVVRLSCSKILQPPTHLSEEELKFIEGVVILEKHFISVIRSQDAMKIELR